MLELFLTLQNEAVVDPGFPRGGGGGLDPFGGHGPSTQALFGKNVCENERIWSHRGRVLAHPLDLPM